MYFKIKSGILFILFITILFLGTLHSEPAGIKDILIFEQVGMSGDTISRTAIGNNLYIKVITNLSAAQINDVRSEDTCLLHIFNTNSGDSIFITFDRKISGDTGSADSTVYEISSQNIITIKNSGWTNNTLNYIGANWSDLIKINIINFSCTKEITVAKPTEPATINYLNFMTSNFETILSSDYHIAMNEFLYLQAVAQNDAEPLMVDSIPVTIKNADGSVIFNVNLFETSKNSGIYNNISTPVKIYDITNIYDYTIKEVRGSYLTVNARNLSDTIYFINPASPTSIIDAKFTDYGFTNVLSGKRYEKPLQVNAWIQAYDKEPYYIDTLVVQIQNSNSNIDSLQLVLIETAKNSGIFRTASVLTIGDNTNQSLNSLKVNYGETVGLLVNGILVDTILINYSFGPDYLTDLYFSVSGFSNKLSDNYHVDKGERLYIEAYGHSGNPDIIDTFFVTVKNNRTSETITVTMTETFKNSGIYRNSDAYTNDYTNSYYKWIGARLGDTISIYSTYGSFSDAVSLITPVPPSNENIIASYFIDENGNFISEDSIAITSKIKIEMLSIDMEPRYSDTKIIYIKNFNNDDSIYVLLTEVSSGKLKNISEITFSGYTNVIEGILRAAEGDRINLIIDGIVRDTIYISVNNPTIFANSFNFITFEGEISSIRTDTSYPSYATVNIELNGIDNNPNIINYIYVTLMNTYNETITIRLNETEYNTGKFRGLFYLRTFTSQYNGYIQANNENDTVGIIYDGINQKRLELKVRKSTDAGRVISLRLKKDGSFFEDLDHQLNFDDVVYVELVAEDSNPNTVDYTDVECFSGPSLDPVAERTISVQLKETDPSSGIFRGTFRLSRLSNDTIDELKITYGNVLTVTSVTDNTKIHTANITIPVEPLVINELKFYTNPSYNEILPDNKQMDFYNVLYIQATASDLNSLNADTVGVVLQDAKLYRTGDQGDSIIEIETYTFTTNNVHFSLVETGKHTGIYRGAISIGPDNLDNELGKIIGTSRSNTILLFWQKDYDNWVDSGKTPATQPVLRSKVKMIQYDQPDYIYAIEFMKNEQYAEVLRTPHLTLGQAIESNISELKYIYVRAYADTKTASDLLEDTIELSLKIYKCDTYGQILWDKVNEDKLSERSDVGSDSDSFNVVTIKLVEVGQNSGIYTNINDVKSILDIYDFGTIGQNVKIDRSLYPYHLLVVEPTIRHAYNTVNYALSGKKAPLNSTDSGTFVADTSYIAFSISPSFIDSINIYESPDYINILTPSERTPEEPYNKLYIKAEDNRDLTDTKIGEISINYFSNDVLKDEIYLHLTVNPNLPIFWTDYTEMQNEYGDTKLRVKLVETTPSSNRYVIDLSSVPTLVTRMDANTPRWTEQNSQLLHVMQGDTIDVQAYNDITKTYVSTKRTLFSSAVNRAPELIGTVKVMNLGYGSEYYQNFLTGKPIYFQAFGSAGKSNTLLVDTVPITVYNLRSGDTISFYLTETAIGSEIYRLDPVKFNYPRLDPDFGLPSDNILQARSGDSIVAICTGSVNSIGRRTNAYFGPRNVASPRKPEQIFAIRLKKDMSGLLDYSPLENFARGTTVCIEMSADIGDNALVDNTYNDVYVENQRGQTITVVLTEDGPATGKYRGSFKLEASTNDTLDEIGLLDSETFAVYHRIATEISSAEYRIGVPEPPVFISSLGLKDNSFANSLMSSTNNTVLDKQQLYIELNGEDKNLNLVDKVDIYILSWEDKNVSTNLLKGMIKINLLETGIHTGKYRGIVKLGDFNDTDQFMIKANQNDILGIIECSMLNDTAYAYPSGITTTFDKIKYYTMSGYADTAWVAVTSSPSLLFGITVKSSDYTQTRNINRSNPIRFGEILYIEAQGDVANHLLIDTTIVTIYGYDINGNVVPGTEVKVELVESEIASGTYRGKVKIAEDQYTNSKLASAYYMENSTYISGSLKKAITDNLTYLDDPYLPIFGPLSSRYFDIKWTFQNLNVAYTTHNNLTVQDLGVDVSPQFNVFPNPWKKNDSLYDNVEYKGTARSGIKFTGLDNEADIKIFDINGQLIYSGKCEPDYTYGYGQFLWEGQNKENQKVSSGVYVYVTRDKEGLIKKGKIAVIR
ncbi:hypothetical protein KA977_05345 [Candidatus Dependentiae bacterium]|nr:hypothetical protein [Candidatus Dependentiae bacterium]